MGMPKRILWGVLGVIGLALVGAGALALANWDTISKSLIATLDTQSEKTEATLFRWGELMSISAELKAHYGAEPDLTYDTSTGQRTLNIGLNDYRLPEQVTAESHAREIAVFAIGKTKKSKQIDVVTVRFQDPGSQTFSFAREELMPNQPQAAR